METKSIDSGNLNDSVQLIDTIEVVRQTQADDENRMKQLLDAQRLLERQRYSFPENWTSMETIQNSWTSMNDSLKRKEQIVDRQVRRRVFFSFVRRFSLSAPISVGHDSRQSQTRSSNRRYENEGTARRLVDEETDRSNLRERSRKFNDFLSFDFRAI